MSPYDIWAIGIGIVAVSALGWAEARDDVPPSVPNAIAALFFVALDALRGFPSLHYTAALVFLLLGGAVVEAWTDRRAGGA